MDSARLMLAKLSRRDIRRENDNILNMTVETELSESSRETCHVRHVHVSVNGSFCGVLARQVFPLTSELRGGIGTRKLAERDREMNGEQGV